LQNGHSFFCKLANSKSSSWKKWLQFVHNTIGISGTTDLNRRGRIPTQTETRSARKQISNMLLGQCQEHRVINESWTRHCN
jgi:hypothetical protein